MPTAPEVRSLPPRPWTWTTPSRGGGGCSRSCGPRSTRRRRRPRGRRCCTGGTCRWRSWRARWGSRPTGGSSGCRCPRPGASAPSPASAPPDRRLNRAHALALGGGTIRTLGLFNRIVHERSKFVKFTYTVYRCCYQLNVGIGELEIVYAN